MGEDNALKEKETLSLRKMCFPLVIALAKMHTGFMIGWATNLPKIQADNSTSIDLSAQDIKWLVSSMGITGISMTLAVGPIIELVGPRRLLYILMFPGLILWLLKAFTPYLSLLYLARIGLSLIFTIFGPLTPMLISELSKSKVRGFVLAMEQVMVSLGILLMYIMAQGLYWRIASALCAVPFLFLVAAMYFIPESPYWLIRKGRMEAAEESLLKLRGSKAEAATELAQISDSIKQRPQRTIKEQIRALGAAENSRPVALLTCIFILRELGGDQVIFNYSVFLFQQADVGLDAFTCTVLLGSMRLIFSIISSMLLDRLGRRPVLIATCFTCCLATAASGVLILANVSGASWVPLAALLIYVASYALGLGPIPWGLIGEMIPTPVRSVGGTICIFLQSVTYFGLNFTFPILVDALGIGVIFIAFTTSLLTLTIILWFLFPETRGKTLVELQNTFKKKKPQETKSPA